ncbi:MAG: hypothetical protein O3A00_03285 [Planctomycetota bacterium]|nr:hypothetical protein [Planctomycetota bacterium]
MTRFDLVSSMMSAIAGGLVLAVLGLVLMWIFSRPPSPAATGELELIELPGGEEDGAIDETLKVESPEELSQDPSLANDDQESEIAEVLDNVMEVSDKATQMSQPTFSSGGEHHGKPGSANGTGRAPLGAGGPGAGLGREDRWFISFNDKGTVDEYARQLEFFGIQLGALVPGKLVQISKVAQKPPSKVTKTTGKGMEKILRFNWQGGDRRRADVALFKRAAHNAQNELILHFYPSETENILAKLELAYRNRKATEIRRTYFVVRSEGSGYKFVVTRQTYLR